MKHIVLTFMGVLGLFQEATAWAGTITSSGGQIISDQTNPWFLENTSEVTYCIDRDPDAFHADEEVIERSIRDTFDSWIKAIRKITPVDPSPSETVEPYKVLRLATQTFTLVPQCDDSVDIRFQLGKLSQEQQEIMGDPREYVGEAVRTAYDTKKMRAKGFIYIAADSGPLRPDSDSMMARPWELDEGLILRVVLTHEIGHIFGLPHTNDGGVMDAKAPGLFVSIGDSIQTYPELKLEIQQILSAGTVFAFPEQLVTSSDCDVYQSYMEMFFEIPNDQKCHKLEFSETVIPPNTLGTVTMKILTAPSKDGPWVEYGKAQGQMNESKSHSLVEVRIPKDQEVFTKLPTNMSFGRTIDVLDKASWHKVDAVFTTPAGVRKEFVMRLEPNAVYSFSAIVNGKMKLDFD